MKDPSLSIKMKRELDKSQSLLSKHRVIHQFSKESQNDENRVNAKV